MDRQSKIYYCYSPKRHYLENLPPELEKLWCKYKSEFVLFFECTCIFGGYHKSNINNGWTIGYYLPRKDNSRNYRLNIQFTYSPDGKLYRVAVSCACVKRMDWVVDGVVPFDQLDDSFFQYLLKFKKVNRKNIKPMCEGLEKLIKEKEKLHKMKEDFL
jgi:hypothetical protein